MNNIKCVLCCSKATNTRNLHKFECTSVMKPFYQMPDGYLSPNRDAKEA